MAQLYNNSMRRASDDSYPNPLVNDLLQAPTHLERSYYESTFSAILTSFTTLSPPTPSSQQLEPILYSHSLPATPEFQSNRSWVKKAHIAPHTGSHLTLTGLGIQCVESCESTDALPKPSTLDPDIGMESHAVASDYRLLESSPVLFPLTDPFLDHGRHSFKLLSGLSQSIALRDNIDHAYCLDECFSDTSFLQRPARGTQRSSRTQICAGVPQLSDSLSSNLIYSSPDFFDSTMLPGVQSPTTVSSVLVDINMFSTLDSGIQVSVRPQDVMGGNSAPSGTCIAVESMVSSPFPIIERGSSSDRTVDEPTHRNVAYDADPISPAPGFSEGSSLPELVAELLPTGNDIMGKFNEWQAVDRLVRSALPLEQWPQVLDRFLEIRPQTTVTLQSILSQSYLDSESQAVVLPWVLEVNDDYNHMTLSSSATSTAATCLTRRPLENNTSNSGNCLSSRITSKLLSDDPSFAQDVFVNNPHQGISEDIVVHKVAYYRKLHPGQKLPDSFLFSFAGKLSHFKETTSGFRCYITNCDKTTKRKDHMADHVRTHIGEKPFRCKTCGLGFIRSNDCQRHENNHSADKKFICVCKSAFSRRDLFIRHKRASCPWSTGGLRKTKGVNYHATGKLFHDASSKNSIHDVGDMHQTRKRARMCHASGSCDEIE